MGALARARGAGLVQISAVQTQLVDTTGAGDAFAAGFIQGWINSSELLVALESAATLASKCVAIVGARPLL